MPVTMHSLGIDRLPLDEQVALVREIWDHIIASGAKPALRERRSRNCAAAWRRTTPIPIT